ncbi:MAG: efflux RND transporter permease subunit [Desulfuromonadales bacterium]|nr:efflux RND transporter permease subunit [Desulfuromonadales bacterium]MDH3868864.1 efflux RND transporter permease subunit [Desulfuromonadales bacterium]MDH3960144.1 efflux RND transporter permease subunit [Desulfuromonadales bacterium]MDH4024750.1 efflux RND transporter permease subunit [Desulfuromonadales bacterium]
MKPTRKERWQRGPLAWMIYNRVTPNLLMIALIMGGFFVSGQIKKEVFPEFELDRVTVSVAYPGASPEEVEQGIVLVVEEAVRGLEGIKELTSRASEGSGSVSIELLADINQQKVYQDIKQEVDRIRSFPDDAEEPQVSLVARRREVLNIQLYGNTTEAALRETAEQVRDRLLQDPEITQIDLSGARDLEIHVNVPQEKLRAYKLTLDDIARTIDAASTDVPGGAVETDGGDILLRVTDRRDWANEFARIPIISASDGTVVRLEDIATVREAFEDSNRFATYNGQRSIGLDVYRVGAQTPVGVSRAVRNAMTEIEADITEGIDWAINRDRSEIYEQRLNLLLKNAGIGLCLVLLLLGLFLEFKLAFWVTMGIPISFLGGLLFLPALGVSINIVSMFAFIVALGIVVDDAIVAGENIYEYRQRGHGMIKAAILGARTVAIPITFAILTNIVAFMPLYFVPGVMGKIWKAIPVVVITVFAISLVEALFILPAHLAHTRSTPASKLTARLHEWQQNFSAKVSNFIDSRYRPLLKLSIRWRGLTVAIGMAVLMIILSYVMSGRIGMILMPRVESDRAVVTAVLPAGSTLSAAEMVQKRLVVGIERVAAENGGDKLLQGVYAEVNESEVGVTAYLTPPNVRPLNTGTVTNLWREEIGPIIGLESLRYESDRGGPGGGAALTVELSHRDTDVLDRASANLAERLAEFSNVKDVDDGFTPGKEQLDFRITPRGESLGLTSRDIARQVRNAFSGTTALRQQRGRNEVTVRVRLPESERSSEFNIENLMLKTPAGTFVPLFEVAEVTRGRAYTTINRREARRTVSVSAGVEPISETGQILATLNSQILPELAQDFPGLTYGYQGRQARMKESTGGLANGFIMAMIAIYFLLAIPFRSYSQPMVVMLAIPFGVVGAVLGHLIMGYSLSLMSMMGIVALSGVVVNDSLVLIDYANRQRLEGASAFTAVCDAGARRFRPIILTTLTTFGGLAPMIFETSRQARFLIPMALSLGFGILFATVITLLLVPSLYLLVDDVLQWYSRIFGAVSDEEGS